MVKVFWLIFLTATMGPIGILVWMVMLNNEDGGW